MLHKVTTLDRSRGKKLLSSRGNLTFGEVSPRRKRILRYLERRPTRIPSLPPFPSGFFSPSCNGTTTFPKKVLYPTGFSYRPVDRALFSSLSTRQIQLAQFLSNLYLRLTFPGTSNFPFHLTLSISVKYFHLRLRKT